MFNGVSCKSTDYVWIMKMQLIFKNMHVLFYNILSSKEYTFAVH